MEVDRVPLSQLPSRYGIARSALYIRLKDLDIQPEKQGAYGEEFEDAGFVFVRAGVRKGGEIAWAIDKKPLAEALAPSLPGGIGVKEAFSDEFDPEAD